MRVTILVCIISFLAISEEPSTSSSKLGTGDWVLFTGEHTLMIADKVADFERKELTSLLGGISGNPLHRDKVVLQQTFRLRRNGQIVL